MIISCTGLFITAAADDSSLFPSEGVACWHSVLSTQGSVPPAEINQVGGRIGILLGKQAS